MSINNCENIFCVFTKDSSRAQLKIAEESLSTKVQEISDMKALVADAEAFATQATSKFQSLETRVQELEALNECK